MGQIFQAALTGMAKEFGKGLGQETSAAVWDASEEE
jgi:hypothetical protein